MIKLFSLIILTLIINERTIQCESDKFEEALYNKARLKCNAANNEQPKCFDDGIYYLDINENQDQNWEKARQLCSKKFYGSSYADLISLDGVERVNETKEILKNYYNDNGNKGKSIHFFA